LNLIDPPTGAASADIDFAAVQARPAAMLAVRAAAKPAAAPEPQAMALRVTGAEDARPLPPDSPYALRSAGRPAG
jgi:hypothetical protein